MQRSPKAELPPIPAKRYFTIGEVSDLCAVKPHVLRYWEQEFAQLKPVKRRGNRRYYQHHEVLLIRRIRDLLYEQGFTINGARHRLESEVTLPGALPASTAIARQSPPAANSPTGLLDFPLLRSQGRGRGARRTAAGITAHPSTAGPRPMNAAIIRGSCRGVAQPGSAPAWGAGGRRFNSSRPDQFSQPFHR